MSEEEKILLLKTNLELSIKLEQANHVIEEWQKRYCKYRHYIIKEKSKRRKEDLIKENDLLKERIEEAIEKLKFLNAVAVDYDGYRQVDSLMGLIDELVQYSSESIEILKGGSNE